MVNSAVRIPEHVLVQRFEQETVLFNLSTEHYYALDEVGGRMVELLTGSSASAAIEALLAEYDTTAAQLQSDLDGLVEKLVAAGLLERLPA